MEFWFVITVLILVVLALLARVVLRDATRLRPWGRYNLDVYRDHLDEVERDLERAIISAEEAGLLRTEVSRRILSADSAAKEQTNDSQTGPIGAVLVLAAIGIAAAVLVYVQQGRPGYADLALSDRIQAAEELRQNRPSQSNAERLTLADPTVTPSDDFLALMEKLRRAVAQHPDDLRVTLF